MVNILWWNQIQATWYDKGFHACRENLDVLEFLEEIDGSGGLSRIFEMEVYSRQNDDHESLDLSLCYKGE